MEESAPAPLAVPVSRASAPGVSRATVMLVLTTFLWALSFPLNKHWMDRSAATVCPGGELVAGLTIFGVRSLLALPLVIVFLPHLVARPTRREWGTALGIGAINCVGCVMAAVGLAYTSPAVSGFFVSLGGAWVPLLAFVFLRQTVNAATLVGLGFAVAGAGVLGVRPEESWGLGTGEGLTLLSSVVYAIVIILLDRFGRHVPTGHLTVGFIAGSGLPALGVVLTWALWTDGGAAWWAWLLALVSEPSVLAALLALTLFPTVLALHWMSVYQPQLPASRAALIYFLEPVFVAVLSVACGFDRVSGTLLAGGALILAGNALVELPGWLRARR